MEGTERNQSLIFPKIVLSTLQTFQLNQKILKTRVNL
jgi:hypothetical protein